MVGENGLKRILSDFFSPKNQDVESFLKKRSIEFTKSIRQLHISYFLP